MKKIGILSSYFSRLLLLCCTFLSIIYGRACLCWSKSNQRFITKSLHIRYFTDIELNLDVAIDHIRMYRILSLNFYARMRGCAFILIFNILLYVISNSEDLYLPIYGTYR
jgi:hypothetical protein